MTKENRCPTPRMGIHASLSNRSRTVQKVYWLLFLFFMRRFSPVRCSSASLSATLTNHFRRRSHFERQSYSHSCFGEFRCNGLILMVMPSVASINKIATSARESAEMAWRRENRSRFSRCIFDFFEYQRCRWADRALFKGNDTIDIISCGTGDKYNGNFFSRKCFTRSIFRHLVVQE